MEINVAWLYPDILNLHGDRGNVMALISAAEAAECSLNIHKVSSHEDVTDFQDTDLIIMGAGQLRDMRFVTEDMRLYADKLKAYAERGGHILATGSTGCILGKKYRLDDGQELEGLGILDMAAKALNRTRMPMLTREVYGDDIYWKTEDGMEIIGCQIQRMDFKLGKGGKPFGRLIYGYGNNCSDGTEGARYKNVLFTNTVGPLLACNPWLVIKIFGDIAAAKGQAFDETLADSVDFAGYAKEALSLKKKFIREKKKLPNIISHEF